jgi:hypothetical protein
MRVWNVIAGTVVLGTGAPVLLHHAQHGVVSPIQVALAFFLWLNVIIALWEICLLLRIDLIEERHAREVAAYRGKELALVRELMYSRVRPSRLLSPTLWAGVWSSYALYDDSYASRRSFGFFIDVGNGLSTLLPSLLVLYGLTFHVLPARALGVIALLLCYQMLYGTIVYLFSYFHGRKHAGRSPLEVATIVGLTNGVWLVFPIIGVIAAIAMIDSGTYAIVLR